ncbi:polysaccharide deacetylase family protein [Actinoplanes sp. NPDC049548]|uniref:polysaccharide deacetylase family protein n=1 Tax=Actinoplanes sp. NPDC049548 TaxID=3155152 RepID=UPI003412038D
MRGVEREEVVAGRHVGDRPAHPYPGREPDGKHRGIVPQSVVISRSPRATFCLVGHRVRDNKALVRRIAAEGHTLCNHSWDLEATNEQLHRAAPDAEIKYFRAPYGNFSPRLADFAARLGMTPLRWNVDDQCYLTADSGRPAHRRLTAGHSQTRPILSATGNPSEPSASSTRISSTG